MSDVKGAEQTQRLFFALQPPPELQTHFAQAVVALLPDVGRPVRAENLHCTLVFLGQVGKGQRLCLEDAASRIQATPFQLTFDHLGYFRRPQVAWFGCKTTPAALQTLVGKLQQAAATCGFPPEQRPYEVHLTAVRKLRRDPGPLRCIPITWPVDRFILMASVSEERGVSYKPIRAWNL